MPIPDSSHPGPHLDGHREWQVHPLGDIPDEYVGDRPYRVQVMHTLHARQKTVERGVTKWANIPFIAAAQQLIKLPQNN